MITLVILTVLALLIAVQVLLTAASIAVRLLSAILGVALFVNLVIWLLGR
ncbi:hypothetical protein [Rhizobium sp. BR 314]